MLANALGSLGRADEARAAWGRVQAIHPMFTAGDWAREIQRQAASEERAAPHLAGLRAAGMLRLADMRRFDESPFEVVATGLEYPEGPIAGADGSVLLVEVKGGRLTRVRPDGTKATVATTGKSPNGAAFGPDGKVYICNSGGFVWIPVGPLWVTGPQPPDYQGGSIQRVDATTGAVETVHTSFATTNPVTKGPLTLPLRGPDDLVFDATGGFWFSDWGKTRLRDRDVTGVYYVPPDGSQVLEVLFPLNAPNGIALSPDGTRLYVAETYTRRVLSWNLAGPGRIAPNPGASTGRRC